MSLRGSLRTMSVEDLLDWINRRFVCGSLTVERGSAVRTFQFDSGYVTSASSNDPAEHLGHLLMDRGLCTEEQLQEAFDVQADTGVLLGKILIMVGAVTEPELRPVLEEKISEAIYDALGWTEGSFHFERAPESATVSEFEISVNLERSIELGLRRVAEWRELREMLPSDDILLFMANDRKLFVASDSDQKRAEIERLVRCVNQGLTINQIILELNGRRFAVISGLVELVERGALAAERRTEVRSDEDDDVQELERTARGRAARGDRAGALEIARTALDRDPENESLQKLHRELERSVFAELSRDLLSSFKVPKLLMTANEIETLEMTDTERYLAARIDGRWDLLSLMRIAPIREVEALITFKRLADRGIISL